MKHRDNLKNFLSTDLYCITADKYSQGRGNIETAKQMINCNIKVIQYREKDKDMKEMYEECLTIRELTRDRDVTFIINDYVDLAIRIQADGVHVGQNDMPPEKVRKLVGDKMVIGVSTHSPAQAHEAKRLEGIIDYIGVGPIFATQTKEDVCEPVGLEYLDYIVKNIHMPFVAIGGIKRNNIKLVRNKGGRIISLVTEIVGAPDIADRINEIRNILSSSHQSNVNPR